MFSNLSCQHHSAGTQFGFFEIQTNVGFSLKRFVFRQNILLKHFDIGKQIVSWYVNLIQCG